MVYGTWYNTYDLCLMVLGLMTWCMTYDPGTALHVDHKETKFHCVLYCHVSDFEAIYATVLYLSFILRERQTYIMYN